jgi:hypothetical protein
MPGTNGSAAEHENAVAVPPTASKTKKAHQLSQQQVQALLHKLQVPFDPVIVQWRVVETAKTFGKLRGRVIPYADKLAYQERLNELVTAIGWTQSLVVHTSETVQREQGRPQSAKVVVICQLTIHGLGSHSSTGEEWATDENGATTAEAQAFKRACALFGLGAYLYYFFKGVWVDLDGDEQPINVPPLPDWATPDGWLQGARPRIDRARDASNGGPEGSEVGLIRQIEALHATLGAQLYRRMLKDLARVWEPKQISSPEHARKVLAEMKTAEEWLMRGGCAVERLGKDRTEEILKSFNLKAISDFAELATLERVVLALEAKLCNLEEAN